LILEMIGAEVTFAHNGAEAVERWSAATFDLILMDIQMPVMDGLTATRRLRELERQTGARRAPVVAVTANAMPHQVQECLDAGMDAHVAKPIRPAELFEAIDRVRASAVEAGPLRSVA
jgi:CheY-like chemotaxis protein